MRAEVDAEPVAAVSLGLGVGAAMIGRDGAGAVGRAGPQILGVGEARKEKKEEKNPDKHNCSKATKRLAHHLPDEPVDHEDHGHAKDGGGKAHDNGLGARNLRLEAARQSAVVRLGESRGGQEKQEKMENLGPGQKDGSALQERRRLADYINLCFHIRNLQRSIVQNPRQGTASRGEGFLRNASSSEDLEHEAYNHAHDPERSRSGKQKTKKIKAVHILPASVTSAGVIAGERIVAAAPAPVPAHAAQESFLETALTQILAAHPILETNILVAAVKLADAVGESVAVGVKKPADMNENKDDAGQNANRGGYADEQSPGGNNVRHHGRNNGLHKSNLR